MKTTITILITGLICLANYNLSAQNAPITTIGSVETYNDNVIVPITVTEFTNIGACDLLITYDSTMASATSVSVGPGVGYMFFVPNTLTQGQISISWLFFQPGIPGLSLPDNSVFLNITFERTGYGNSAIEFDNSNQYSCNWTDDNAIELNDIPHSTYYADGSLTFEMIDAPFTSVPDIEDCEGSESIDIPVTVSNFNQIGAFNLNMEYDAQVYSYQSFTNESGFPGLEVIETSPGTIVIDGITDAAEGFAIENNSILCTIHFNNLGGSTSLTWIDTGETCSYKGPAPEYEPRNDNPQSTFYMNGSFTENPLPEEAGLVTGPEGGIICQGESEVLFSITPIPYTNTYNWILPEGTSINSGNGTNEISVSFSGNAISGDVSVYGINECGNGIVSPLFPITIEMAPAEAGIVTGPVGGIVCQGISGVLFNIVPVPNTNTYYWVLPEGAIIDNGASTNEISVSFTDNAISGDVSVYGINECGNGIESPAFPITIETAPLITSQPVSPDTVYADDGIASFSVITEGTNLSYQWQEYIDDWTDITDGGVYSGSTTTFLTITNPPVSMDGNYYRCIVSGNCDPPAVTDGNAILTVIVYTGLDINNYGNSYENLNFRSFPNPFSEQITFSFNAPSKGVVAIKICNAYGEKVRIFNKTISGIDDNLITINTRNLKPGIYTASITFKSDKTIIRNTLIIISDN